MTKEFRGGKRSAQRGMSLIEVLVGLTIGLIVIFAAVASLLVVRESSRTMADSAALEQQATFAMQTIGRSISQTRSINAYLSSSSPDSTGTLPASGDPWIKFDTRPIGVAVDTGGVPLSTLSIFGVDGDPDASPPTSDTLAISYATPNDGSLDGECSFTPYNPPSSAPRVLNIFYVDNTVSSLACQPRFPIVPILSGPRGAIAGNVLEMRVHYLNLNPDTGALTYYARAADVTAVSSTNWHTINGVQVCLELVGDYTQAGSRTFKDCNGNDKTPADGRMHRVIRNTFYMRNVQL